MLLGRKPIIPRKISRIRRGSRTLLVAIMIPKYQLCISKGDNGTVMGDTASRDGSRYGRVKLGLVVALTEILHFERLFLRPRISRIARGVRQWYYDPEASF